VNIKLIRFFVFKLIFNLKFEIFKQGLILKFLNIEILKIV